MRGSPAREGEACIQHQQQALDELSGLSCLIRLAQRHGICPHHSPRANADILVVVMEYGNDVSVLLDDMIR